MSDKRAGVPLPLGHTFWRGWSRRDRCRILLAGETTCGQPKSAHEPHAEPKPEDVEDAADAAATRRLYETQGAVAFTKITNWPAQPPPAPEPRQIEQQFGVVIVSRHAGAVEWLRRRGITGRVVEHAYPEDVRQKIVYGILPFHLAALAKELVMIDTPLIPLERRGGDLSPEEMDRYGAALTHYVVLRVPQTAGERDE